MKKIVKWLLGIGWGICFCACLGVSLGITGLVIFGWYKAFTSNVLWHKVIGALTLSGTMLTVCSEAFSEEHARTLTANELREIEEGRSPWKIYGHKSTAALQQNNSLNSQLLQIGSEQIELTNLQDQQEANNFQGELPIRVHNAETSSFFSGLFTSSRTNEFSITNEI